MLSDQLSEGLSRFSEVDGEEAKTSVAPSGPCEPSAKPDRGSHNMMCSYHLPTLLLRTSGMALAIDAYVCSANIRCCSYCKRINWQDTWVE